MDLLRGLRVNSSTASGMVSLMVGICVTPCILSTLTAVWVPLRSSFKLDLRRLVVCGRLSIGVHEISELDFAPMSTVQPSCPPIVLSLNRSEDTSGKSANDYKTALLLGAKRTRRVTRGLRASRQKTARRTTFRLE